jgi:uncharacterized LabA/DUF88 family protein
LNASRRTIVYVDGFNLYYGALKGTAYKWLDLEALFRRLRSDDDLVRIRYFTALVEYGAHRQRQACYLGALAASPLVEIILGRFKLKEVKCTYAKCELPGQRVFTMPEEKRTDVNIATHMVDDAYQDRCDQFVLVSGDSDLVAPLRLIRERFPSKRIVLYVPARERVRSYAVELRSTADKHRELPLNLLPLCQLPASVPDGSGGLITKPPGW